MGFNLKRAKLSRKPLARLRSFKGCEGLRPSDLDGMEEKEMHNFFHSLREAGSAKDVKTAYHGQGDTFFPVGPDYNPYKTSPLVNNPGPEFGGRWRRDFPGSGDQHINDDSDKPKSESGHGDDSDPSGQKRRINELLTKIKGPAFMVKVDLSEEEEPTEERAKGIFGEKGQTDGKSVFIIVDGYEEALRFQHNHPKAVIERKK